MTRPEGALASGARWWSHGRGEPVTLVVPGLGATAGEARVPAAGLPGTRVVLTLPGHPGPDGHTVQAAAEFWTYPRMAAAVAEAAEAVGADGAIGTSLGADIVLSMLADSPDAFRRVALLLPAAFDRQRSDSSAAALAALAGAVADADDDRLRDLVAADLPEDRDSGDYVQRRVAALAGLLPALRQLPGQVPVPEPETLADADVRALVLAASGDRLHPHRTARRVADALPRARLLEPPSRAPLITHRRLLRSELAAWCV